MRTILAASLLMMSLVTAAGVYHEIGGLAIGGYDPVAYVVEQRAVRGVAAHQLQWEGSEWHFSSPENLKRFQNDPKRYAPQYGGHCAYAAAKGSLAYGDPEAWTIEGGKLYLNYNNSVRATWRKDRSSYIRRADSNWPRLSAGLR